MFDLDTVKNFNDKIALKYYETVDSVELFSYSAIHIDSLKVKECIEKLLPESRDQKCWNIYNIGILLPTHSPVLLPAIIGIANTNGASCFIDTNDSCANVIDRLKTYQTNIIFTDFVTYEKMQFSNQFEIDKKCFLQLSSRNCVIFQIKLILDLYVKMIPIDHSSLLESSKILFCATTSGTTGGVKTIQITYKCFMPNIFRLGEIYSVSANDMIFVSSPQTFDPFMVDVCLALFYGATLVMVNNNIRLAPKHLLNLLFPMVNNTEQFGVTIMQTTPSLLMRWPNKEIAERVFAKNSTLRILALGGECFPPTTIIEKWQNWNDNDRIRVFNLYGLTEISCWSSIYEITSDDVILNNEIPIGIPLDHFIRFDVTPNNELLIKTNVRKCFQNQLPDVEVLCRTRDFILSTGDIVEAKNKSRIIFKMRTDSVIKVYGKKINLNDIEMLSKELAEVHDVCCVYEKTRHFLILFIIAVDLTDGKQFCDIQKKIMNLVHTKGIDVPIEFYQIDEFPLSSHGKRSKRKLLEIFELNEKIAATNKSYSEKFLQVLNRILNTKINSFLADTEDKLLEASFLSLGGSSLKATYLTTELEHRLDHSFHHLLPMLLNENIPIRDIILYINTQIIESHSSVATTSNNIAQQIYWTIDMKKCIDATPTVCKIGNDVIVSVGSHSKLLYNVSVLDGALVSSIELPDRIESQVTEYNTKYGIVGCYDGHLYCFDLLNGNIEWKFNSNGMIKCKTLIINSLAIFGNYSNANNLWCLNANNGKFLWSQRIGTKSIYANPVLCILNDLIVCTLDGTVARVNATTGSILWTISIGFPIFSTPSILTENNETFIIIGSVNGIVHCLNNDGNKLWSRTIDGNIFSSFAYFTSKQNTEINLIFASHNHYLYCFSFDTTNRNCEERWKFDTGAQIRATPRLIEFYSVKCILNCSTDGTINIVNADSGQPISRFKIDGGLFSSPTIYENKVFIGSRNNQLYCIALDQSNGDDQIGATEKQKLIQNTDH